VRVYAATKNPGKLRELRAIFGAAGWDVTAPDAYAEPSEGDESYADNAALKARTLAAQLRAAGICDAAVVADDSGLEVGALGGRPGVLSARYVGAAATWSERRRLLLAELVATCSSDRSARFVCAMHYIGPDGRETAAEAAVDGTVAHEERGEGGFSYDAIFSYPPAGKTFGELTEEQKNAVSHRTRAARALLARMDEEASSRPAIGM
jgi:XTP/dITP diphosphohydrolase